MKANCAQAFTNYLVSSALFQNVSDYEPLATGNVLPSECLGINPSAPNYANCFNWINANLIQATMVPNYYAIMHFQATMNANSRLRLLQSSSNAQVNNNDPTTSDSSAQMNSSQYELQNSDMSVDSSSPTAQSSTQAQAAAFVTPSSTGAGFIQYSFGIFAILAFLLF